MEGKASKGIKASATTIGVYEKKCKLHIEVTSKVEGKWSAL
jgi:hypothetical protein